mmetsp:Transcript_3915/g.5271  ORF Transcript_3915/g.5271 Transcript_3915/m.5271 type:complete len:340 (-) Transcript_3915:122-1141(-)|eukprot:CAMPEP_0185732988 /NCGR_PEP_ID=MMETSP1171-20130828/18102_1 /TAXON_ID=374046 /ORGANISM="Helicotheca tamensis, Strain CCMP826" /LENGTH=339 /DNA_ID=CAMNT_0028402603 /DNA_START=90 /DNA_END=1109 /DNA_ORIENTATION=+
MSPFATGAIRHVSSLAPTPSSWLRLANQTAIITGAASGIGSTVAQSFAAEGCNVILADVDKSGIKDVSLRCHDLHNGVFSSSKNNKEIIQRHVKAVMCDVTDENQVKKLIHEADDIASKVVMSLADNTEPSSTSTVDSFPLPSVSTILVNCAGITRDTLFTKMSVDDFEKVMDVNLKGTFLTCKEFCSSERLEKLSLTDSSETLLDRDNARRRRRRRRSIIGGSIVNIGSIISQTGNVGQANYAASKGAVWSFTKSLAKEMAIRHDGIIRANTILPGFIETPMAQAVPTKILDRMKGKVALGRFGSTEDVANLVLFLSSWERSCYITGEEVECSGMIAV